MLLPESGAAPDVSGANNESTAAGGPTPEVQEQQQPEHQPAPADKQTLANNSRLAAILEEEGIPEDEVKELVKPKEEPNAKETKPKTPASDRAPEGAGAGDATEGDDDKPQAEGQKPESKGGEEQKPGGVEEEKPLSDQEKKTWPAEAVNRIHKATRQREAARTEAKQLREQLQAATRVVPPASAADPLADVSSPQELQRAVTDYENLLQFAETNPDGAVDVIVGHDAKGQPITQDFSAKEMAEIRSKAGRILRQAVPARAGYLREQQQHEAIARQVTPAMFDPEAPEHKEYQTILQHVPELTRIPGYQRWIGWALIGKQVEADARQAAAEKNGAAGKGNGKTAVANPKAAPFLRTHGPVAPGVPAARLSREDAAEKGSKARVTQAQERVLAGDGEEAEVDLVDSLRSGQSRGVLV
jgi:hypothetical protein